MNLIRHRLAELPDVRVGHILTAIIPGEYINQGGLGFKSPGDRSHPGTHVHEDEAEVFIILQGRGTIEIDGESQPIETGDVLIVPPGTDHHLVSSEDDPLINVWLHAGEERHPDQLG